MDERRLVELDREECLQLLATAKVGRVVHTCRALPACTLVNYRLLGHSIVFRTAVGSGLAAATADAVVAFEVDHVDEEAGTGWSVVVTGVASAVRDVSTLARLDQLGLASWAGDHRSHWVHISIVEVKGRRVVALPANVGAGAAT